MSNHQGLKSRNLITLPLDIPDVEILGVAVNEHGDYIVTVESTQNSAICQNCGTRITKSNGCGREIELRHLPILGHRVYIRLRPKRYECPSCKGKTTTQKLDWYEEKSPHTKAYDRYLMLQLVNSTVEDVSRKEDVGYDAVEGAIERCIQVRVDWNQIAELEIIGIDEIAMKKGHRDFVAVITTQQSDGRIALLEIIGIDEIAMKKGHRDFVAIITTQQSDGRIALLGVLVDRQKETVRQFFEHVPNHFWPTMKKVCTDMWEGYSNAVAEFASAHAEVSIEVVVDRFHVAKNYRECVDSLRKQECRRLKKELSEAEYAEIQGVMWPIRKNKADLTVEEQQKLKRIFQYSPDLKLAYDFREELTAIFELPLTKEEAQEYILEWQNRVSQSVLTCFDKFLTTLNNWLDQIVNYFAGRFKLLCWSF